MPKRAANFASGGAGSVRTVSGKRFAFDSGRPLSSMNPAGSVMRKLAAST